MTTKFPKSNISISGNLFITGEKFQDLKHIYLKGLNQSKSGVYCINNKFNGRLYIGMARNLEVRKWRHINDLKKGNHPSKTLQNDFYDFTVRSSNPDLNFDDIFEFEVIIYCYPSQLTFWEGILIDNLHPYYNSKKKKEIILNSDSGLYHQEIDEILGN